jgi:hypothetical protein
MTPQRHHPRRRLRHPPAPGHLAISKQLLPVYDKPMIYYPLSTLMLAGIRDILIISTPQDTPRFRATAGRRQPVGPEPAIRRAAQPRRPGAGLHDWRSVCRQRPSALVLGDNIFYGHDFARSCWASAAMQRDRRRQRVCLPRARPRALWRGRVRCPGPCSASKKSPKPQEQLRRHRPVLLRQPGGRPGQTASSPRRAASWRSPT